MYIHRKADDFLAAWKADPAHLPLIVAGARQIGKTETVLNFGHDNYANVVCLNFIEEPMYKAITEDGYSVAAILKYITRLDPSKAFLPGETLIVFDEIQEAPDVATTLKFFALDGRFDVICTGSLLGVHYRRIHSVSVGYKTDFEMHSLDFEEFLWAVGYDEDLMQDLLDHMETLTPLPEGLRRRLEGLFLDYCVLGGMPAVVSRYLETGTFTGTLDMQKQIVRDYEDDIRKYSEGLDQARLASVFRSVPAQLARENKKFMYGAVRKGGRSKDYLGCIEWLEDAGVVNTCYALGIPALPLSGNKDESKFKLYFADTGLLVSQMDEDSQYDLRANKNLGTYKGALYENMAAEALTKQGYGLYYYKKEDSTLEEDFFVRCADDLVPVEVKAGNSQAKTLGELIRSSRYPEIRWGIKFVHGNIGRMNGVFTFPYFCLFLLRRYLEGRRSRQGAATEPKEESSSRDLEE